MRNNCDVKEKKFRDHFDSDEKLNMMINILQRKIITSAIEASLEGKSKITGGQGINIVAGIDTLKGKKDVELDIEFYFDDSGEEFALEIRLKDINFYEEGTLPDSTIDTISDYIKKGATVIKKEDGTIITKPE